VDLPTYTNIWRIEKRLYKLYDFRLPMPLPVGQIAIFAGIAVPYVVILAMVGLPFSHTLVWLYVLPPGLLAWLATRPVIESKRLPELVASQLRYLAEPRTWCRLAPLAEPDHISVLCRVWRQLPAAQAAAADGPGGAAARVLAEAAAPARAVVESAPKPPGYPAIVTAEPVVPAGPAAKAASHAPGRNAPAGEVSASQAPSASPDTPTAARRPVWPTAPARGVQSPPPQPRPAALPRRPVVRVTDAADGAGREPAPLRVVERALSGPSARPGRGRGWAGGWGDHVVVVPGGHRPGRPDPRQRDRARARLPLHGPRRIVVLGCTVGAGQTLTTLLTGGLLASLRDDPVAVLDLNPGPGSLTELAKTAPSAVSRLEVISASGTDQADDELGRAFELISARHGLTLADPAARAVPRVLAMADQLVLVAPATADAANALAMTNEWLEAHGHGGLAAAAITVLTGVRQEGAAHVAHAESVASGRCRAIVRVPWDDQLNNQAVQRGIPPAAARQQLGTPGPATAAAYTALAGLLVSGLGQAPQLNGARV
jgi:MinD-like ATPase involved in chromosome partitioning or flagellar assembly